MKTISSLKATFPAILDNSMLDDPYINLDIDILKTQLKIELLTNRHIYIPNSFPITNPNLIFLLVQKEFKEIYQTNDLNDYPPLIIGHRKECGTFLDTVDDMLDRKIIFGILSDEQNKKLREPNKTYTNEDFLNCLSPELRKSFCKLDRYVQTNPKTNYEIQLTPSKYKEKVLKMASFENNDITQVDENFKTLCNQFVQEAESRLQTEKDFTRSNCKDISRELCEKLNLQYLRIPFDQVILNHAWQLNLAESDGINEAIQGKPMEHLLPNIMSKFKDDIKNKTGATEDYEIVQLHPDLVKNEEIVSAIDTLQMQDILKIRNQDEFSDNIDQLLDPSISADTRDLVLHNHMDFLSGEITRLGKKIPKIESKHKVPKRRVMPESLELMLSGNSLFVSMWSTLLAGNTMLDGLSHYSSLLEISGMVSGAVGFGSGIASMYGQHKTKESWKSILTLAMSR